VPFVEPEYLFHHIHHGSSRRVETALAQHVCGLFFFLWGKPLAQHVIAVDELAQANAFVQQMARDVVNREDAVEG
jgi:hypothetical protein